MTNCNKDLEDTLKFIQEQIMGSLNMFLGQKANNYGTFSVIKSQVQQIIDGNIANGNISPSFSPLIDINDREELSHIQNQIRGLNDYIGGLFSNVFPENATLRDEAESKLDILKFRYSMLKDNNKDPRSIMVALKDPQTFEPYEWNPFPNIGVSVVVTDED